MKYYKNYLDVLVKNLNCFDQKKANYLEKKIKQVKKSKKKIIFLGNGGSAAISNHCSIDFTKNLKIRTLTFNDTLITCFANDYGHNNWMSKALEINLNQGDLVIFISSSGNSINHLNAAKYCKKNNFFTISLTGFGKNKLSQLTNLNMNVNSKNFNIIENIHSIWLLMILDKIKNFKF